MTIRGVVISDSTYAIRKTGTVLLWLRNETIYFNISGSLTLADVTILGGDMHAENVPCSERAYNVDNPCTCYASITTMDDSQLYNASSACSVMQSYVADFTGVYPGFFQLGTYFFVEMRIKH